MKGHSILFTAACCWMLFVGNVLATVFYVDVNSTNPVPPYAGWSTASKDIQSAVDAAFTGDTVLVTNGVYATGGRGWFGSGTNRVTLTNSITLRSVNGPAVTLIAGNRVTGTGAALISAARCVGMGNNAVLSGFTLTNGEGGFGNYPAGGGVAYVYGSGVGTVTNCILTGNLATNSAGGGANRVTLINCQIAGNSAGYGGGACACALINCTVVSNTASSEGGGVFGGSPYGASILTNCTIAGNSTSGSGGGTYGGTLNACSISSNTASNGGGGTYSAILDHCVIFANATLYRGGGTASSILNDCIVSSNSASLSGGGAWLGTLTNSTLIANSAGQIGGGVDSATLNNCVVYYNSAQSSTNYSSPSFRYCCTTPLPFGLGNITNEPAFVNLAVGDFHLQTNSPCINSGNNSDATMSTDLDGNPRIIGGTVDIGAYEFQTPASILSYAWAQQYGLPTDGTADYADSDGDRMSNYSEWKAGTIPTNAASVLALQSPSNSVSGITVTWQSVSGVTYYLQTGTNLPAFTSIQSNIVGLAGTTSYTDTTATNAGQYFYRVGVQ
jgi:hypothetical protein